jgi:NAD(P)-dependent dehydrogenase (short-subunit alcohol dehydrogenase family)
MGHTGHRGLLEGKVGLVTGAGAGIGRATARVFAREGARVAVADRDVAGGRETVAEIAAEGGEAHFVEMDVSQADHVEAGIAEIVATFGALHCAANNAAASGGYHLTADIPQRAWDRAIAVTLTGVWQCMRFEIPAMLASGGGSIVNISSDAALRGETYLAAYAAAKGGVLALTKTAAAEYALAGIRVNALCPGGVRTAGIEDYFRAAPERERPTVDTHALGRLAEPEEIADSVAWLCSDRSSFTTGSVMVVDGGVLVKSHLL